MENAEPFKGKINLLEFSVVAEAINYWESPTIREKIRQCANDDDFNDVLLEVLRQVKKVCLPLSVKIKIQNVIPLIGKEILHWIRYVTSDLKLGLQYTERMYWTNYGTIDEAKTFQFYWQNDSNLPSEQKIGLPALYSVACINCQEAFVWDNLNHMKEMLQNYCGSLLNIPEDVSAYSLMSIWICCYAKKSKEQGCELYKTVTQSNDPEAKLFEICVSYEFLNGVKYFGHRLKSGRDRLFYRHAVFTLREHHIVRKELRLSDKRNNFIEIIVFLTKKMIPETRSSYLWGNLKNLFEIFIQVWPRNESFLFEILNCSLPDMQEPDQENLLTTVFSYLEELNGNPTTYGIASRSRNFTKLIIRKILGTVLKQTPVELKNKMIIDKAGYFFKKLIYQADFQTIEVIFNDPYIKTHRHEIVTRRIVEAFYHTPFTEKDFDFLHSFTEEYLTGDEKKEFKTNFNNFREVLTEGKLYLFKELVRWKIQSEEEMRDLKMGINAKDVFLYAFSQRKVNTFLSIAERLLNWQFDDDKDEIRAFKERMRSEVPMTDDFIRTTFYNMWNGFSLPGFKAFISEAPERMCSQFLKFIFDCDEAKLFMQEKIAGDKIFIKFLTPRRLKYLNDLLQFCGLTLAEIIELKREKLKDIDSLVLYFAIERSQFTMANDLLNWLVADEDEKQDIIGKFLNSDNGVDLCCKLLGPLVRNGLESALVFLNSWVKPHGNTSELLSGMTKRLETAELSKVKELFKKLEETELTISDLEIILNTKHEKYN